MSFDIKALHNFVLIAKLGGFAKAARHLNVNQSSLSRSLAQLETDIGVKLFDRSTAGTVITSAGERFMPLAQSILRDVQRAKDLFDGGETEEIDIVSLGVSPSLLHEGLSGAVADLMNKKHDLGLNVQTGTLETLLEGVKSRELNVALSFMANIYTRKASDLRDLSVEELSERTLLPAARADHPIFKGPIDLLAASRFSWAVPHQMSVSYRFENAFFRRNFPIPPQRLNCSSMSFLMRGVLDYSLLGMLPESLIRREVERGDLRVIEIPDLEFKFSLAMLSMSDNDRSRGTKDIMTALRMYYGSKECFTLRFE